LDHLQAFLERSGESLLFQTRLRTGLDYGQGIPKVMGQAGDHGFAHHFDPGSPFRLIPQLLNCPDCLVKILQQKIALLLVILEFPLKLPPSKDFLLQGVFSLGRDSRV
jgi:hypothetical protein